MRETKLIRPWTLCCRFLCFFIMLKPIFFGKNTCFLFSKTHFEFCPWVKIFSLGKGQGSQQAVAQLWVSQVTNDMSPSQGGARLAASNSQLAVVPQAVLRGSQRRVFLLPVCFAFFGFFFVFCCFLLFPPFFQLLKLLDESWGPQLEPGNCVGFVM